MSKHGRKDRFGDARQTDRPAAARPRRWLGLVALLAVAAGIGLAIAGTFRGGAPTEPGDRASAGVAAGGLEAQPSATSASPVPSPQAPVPESYDALKQEALALGARLYDRYPDAMEAVDLLARMHTEAGDLAAAARCWRQCLERHPGCAEGYYRLGQYARKGGNDEEAAGCFGKAFKLDPTLPDLQALLGRCLMKLDRVEEALAVLEPDIGPDGGGSVRYAQLGHAYLRTQQYEKAKRAFRTAIEITPSYTGAHYSLATACAKLGQTEEANKHLEDFRKLKAEDTEAAREKVKQDDVARMHRLVAVWYHEAGRVYSREGEIGQAEAHWLRGAAVNPADTQCRRALAELYQRQGR